MLESLTHGTEVRGASVDSKLGREFGMKTASMYTCKLINITGYSAQDEAFHVLV